MFYFLKEATINWLIIFSSTFISLFYNELWLYAIAVLIIGNRQHALSILGHEGAHGLICKNKKINNILCNIFCFYPLLVDLKSYKKFHFAHHKYNGTSRDPELIHKKLIKQWETRNIFLASLDCFLDLFGFGIPNVAVLIYLVNRSNLKKILIILCIHILIYAILWYNSLITIVVLWYASIFTSFWLFFRIRVWTEHVGVKNGLTHRLKKPNPIIEWIFFPCKTWMHDIHHDKPNIPYYQLENKYNEHERISIKKLIRGLFNEKF